MPAIHQIKLNGLCCLRDLNNWKINKFLFHWRGLMRGAKELKREISRSIRP
jgi:hypothetical protein